MHRIPRYEVKLQRNGSLISESPARFGDSRDVYNILKPYFQELDRESCVVLMLDAKHKLIGMNVVSTGSLSMSVVHPREVFKPAILCNADSIIISHHHPTGDPTPSREDHDLTRRLREAGEMIGIPLLDHVICGEAEYFSFADAARLGA